ncbi:MAG: DUF2000 domain-containing protein [Spirochaetae bacterium HGW-Spirochaetae-3]|jgi:hypothetical protein|nr:MAG: DUF2000 domain-containing protein [Spirochaetae bacterium HGW-Spirochaetae-3]
MKAAFIVDGSLPIGVLANCAAVLGTSLGATHPDIVGAPLSDASGTVHPGITGLPLPILAADPELLSRIFREASYDTAIAATAFNDIARSCLSYADYEARLKASDYGSLRFLGILLVGPPKAINRLTGSLPLLR